MAGVGASVTGAVGYSAGLAEIEVFASDGPPLIIEGPVATPSLIDDTQSTRLTVKALDLGGDDLKYSWDSDEGSISGKGPSVVFTPPPVTTATFFTIKVTVENRDGKKARNSAFVGVTPKPRTLVALTFDPTTVKEGKSSEGTVRLDQLAPVGGAVVTLSTSDPAVATLPASVTIPAGSVKATFKVKGNSVTTSTAVTISASYGGVTKVAVLTVKPD